MRKINKYKKMRRKATLFYILILSLIFTFVFWLRLTTLNEMGRTWDEPLYVEQGYHMVEALKKGNIHEPILYETYDHPPLVKYLYGIAAHFDIQEFAKDGKPIFQYDFAFARGLSAFASSLSVLLVAYIGWRLFSPFVGLTAGLLLGTLPIFLGLSQLVTAESWIMLSFTAAVYSYLLLLKKYSLKKLIITGILTGIALQVKQSNAILFLIYFLMLLVWYRQNKKRETSVFLTGIISLIKIGVISIGVFILLWPTLMFHFKEIYEIHKNLWHVQFSPKIWQITLSPPEVFFGRLMLTPIFYYPVYFLITTPLAILALFFGGIVYLHKKKSLIFYMLIFWFLVPFLLSFYSWRQHGVRYIIEVYAPLVLISAVGFEMLIQKFIKQEKYKIFFLLLLMTYMLFLLIQIKPYYLNYFNLLVGGTKNVYDKRLFQLGWWGEGIREGAFFIKSVAPYGSRVAFAVSPKHTIPSLSGLTVEQYKTGEKYDFVLVNYYNIIREGFDDSKIKKKYRLIHQVKTGGASLVFIYKSKQ